MANFNTGENHGNWKGGKYVTEDGYLRFSGGKYRGRYEHRVVWELAHGKIPADKDVHHKNEIRTDNREENLELAPADQHRREALERWNKKRTEERLRRQELSAQRATKEKYIRGKGRQVANAILLQRDQTDG